jgi:hypothetical protein
MESLLRDISREREKMQADMANLNRHYEKLETYVCQYVQQAVMEWAKLAINHPRSLLLVVETTRVLDENGYVSTGESEPIRLTAKSPGTDGEIWDQLVCPTYSCTVRGAEYHGLEMIDLVDKPRIDEAWPRFADLLEDRHIIVFGREWARNALRTVRTSSVLDGAFCLQDKCKEYYNQFYELSLEVVLGYQGIEKTRAELTDSRDRVLMLEQVVRNLAAGMAKKQEPEAGSSGFLDDLEEHPF